MKRYRDIATPFLVFAAFLLIWEAVARIINVSFMLPSFTQVMSKIWELRATLLGTHLLSTLQIVVIGLGLSVALGIGLAVWMNYSRAVERAFYPILVASQTIPIIAIAPIFVLWFGYSIWSKVAVTLLFTFFPITVSTFDGLKSVSNEYKELLQTMGASRKHIFFKLSVPSALPYFYSGIKVGVTLSVIGAAIGEWLGAQAGLGYFSRRMMTQFDGAGVFAPIIILSLLGIVLFLIVSVLERRALRWRNN
ncbi:ABC transporter permease [Paenibacillus senegalimassiliensis]|uniref:ABC transporter permease n=1 Tax=Paenibacillus senegalimassiliensis TaxID=1737426 RepID=UPI00073EFE06|nr:ABC transporter permease [Paenibacillus senegalimassiliensis]